MTAEVELKRYCSHEDIHGMGIDPIISTGVETGAAERQNNTG